MGATKPKAEKASGLDRFLDRLDRPDVEESRQKLAEFVGIDGDLMQATLLHLAADLLPMDGTSREKLHARATYDTCKFACKQGAKIGARHAEASKATPTRATSTPPDSWAHTWRGK